MAEQGREGYHNGRPFSSAARTRAEWRREGICDTLGGMKAPRHFFAFPLFAIVALLATGCPLGPFHPFDRPQPIPSFGEPVPLLSDAQKAYLDLPAAERREKFKDPEFRRTMKEWGDKPAAVAWPAPALAGAAAPVWTLRLAGAGETVASGEADDGPVALSNLMVGTRYVLEFKTRDSLRTAAPGDIVARETPFETEALPPRLLDIPGIPNARDFGGWRGLGGRRIRQGLVIRSAGLNENATPKDNPDTPGATRVTDATRTVMIGRLGVKTDIDLRWDREVFGMTGSPLGPEVRWVRCPWSLYQWIKGDEEKAMFARIFRLLLDPANLPAVVHCIEGQDRTGTLCFLLQGLLGVSDEDKLRDWECTGFANPNTGFRHESRLDPFLKYLATLPGETVNERCESYARSCGVTDEEIAAWRDLLLEPVP